MPSLAPSALPTSRPSHTLATAEASIVMSGFSSPSEFKSGHAVAFKESLVAASDYITSTDLVSNVNASQARRRRLVSSTISVGFELEFTLEDFDFADTGNSSAASSFSASLVQQVSDDIATALNDTNATFISNFLAASEAQNASTGNISIDVGASKASVSSLADSLEVQLVTTTPTPTFLPTSGPSAKTLSPTLKSSSTEDNDGDLDLLGKLLSNVLYLAALGGVCCCLCTIGVCCYCRTCKHGKKDSNHRPDDFAPNNFDPADRESESDLGQEFVMNPYFNPSSKFNKNHERTTGQANSPRSGPGIEMSSTSGWR